MWPQVIESGDIEKLSCLFLSFSKDIDISNQQTIPKSLTGEKKS